MKTNPIGVRFRVDILEKLKTEHNAESPQKALNFLERFFVTHHVLAKDLKQPLRAEVPIKPIPSAAQNLSSANEEILAKISKLENDLKNEPKSGAFSIRAWRQMKLNEIANLKQQLL